MPYFSSYNILFIHIPKTGGSSIEDYFTKKMNKKLSVKDLYSFDKTVVDHSLQHLTLLELYQNKDKLKFNINNIKLMFTVVRNPYERTVSDLFFFKLINKNMSTKEVEKKLRRYLESNNTYDNHKIPQYKFLADSYDNINKDVKIIRNENMNEDMKSLGFNDFNVHKNVTFKNKLNYYNYLNNNSINLINNYYQKDFEIFNYKMISTNVKEDFINTRKNNLNIIFLLISCVILFLLMNIFSH
jgi:hypothetical protein